MINKIEAPTSYAPPYETVPFLEELNDQSREKLIELGFTVETITLELGVAQIAINVLRWPTVEKDVSGLAILLDESLNRSLGDLTDEEFRDLLYKFSDANKKYFNNRKVGVVGRQTEILESRNTIFPGSWSDFLHRSGVLMGAENKNLVVPAENHKLAAREHMLWMPANLRLNDLPISASEKRVIRTVALLHDWGKAVLERNGQHPEIGAAMVLSVLIRLHQTNSNLYPWEFIEKVCWSISMHHILERIFQPTKAESLRRIPEEVDDSQGFWTEFSLSQRANDLQKTLLDHVSTTSLETIQSEHIIRKDQFQALIEFLQILATYEVLPPATLKALSELKNIQDETSAKSLSLIMGLVRMIEADLIATDRDVGEVTYRISQLKLLTQGLLASFSPET